MKKILSLVLALMLTAGLPLSAAASESKPSAREITGDTITAQQLYSNSQPEKRFAYIAYIIHGITIDSSRYSDSSASCRLSKADYEAKLTIRIQKWDGRKYVDTYGPWSDRDTGGAFVSKDDYQLPSGRYRLKTVCEVYNTSGTIVETQTVYSDPRSC